MVQRTGLDRRMLPDLIRDGGSLGLRLSTRSALLRPAARRTIYTARLRASGAFCLMLASISMAGLFASTLFSSTKRRDKCVGTSWNDDASVNTGAKVHLITRLPNIIPTASVNLFK